MPQNIKLQVSRNGGAPAQGQAGGVEIDNGDTLVLSLADPSGVSKVRYRIYEYPDGFELPTGWTDESGEYTFTAAQGIAAPAVTVPDAPFWGDFLLDVVVDDGLRNGQPAADLTDNSLGLTLPSGSETPDFPHREAGQFDAKRSWAAKLKALARKVDELLGGTLGLTFDTNGNPQISQLNGLAGDLKLGSPANLADFQTFGFIGVGPSAFTPSVQFHGRGNNPELRLEEDAGNGYGYLRNTLAGSSTLGHWAAAGSALFDLDALPNDGTSASTFRFFRGVTTTNVARVQICRGDGTANPNHIFEGKNANTGMCLTDGNLDVGSASNRASLNAFGNVTARADAGNIVVPVAPTAISENASLANGGTLFRDYVPPADSLCRITFLVTFGTPGGALFAFDYVVVARRIGTNDPTIQASKALFDAADYTSPPNVTVTPSVVAISDSIRLTVTNNDGAARYCKIAVCSVEDLL